MHAEHVVDRKRRFNLWPATGLLLVIILASTLVGRSSLEGAAMLSAFVIVAGILAMAGLMSRTSPIPAWVLWASAGVMSTVLVTVVLVVPAQAGAIQATAWMLPWFVYVVGGTPDRSLGRCATSSTRGGLLLVGTSLVLSLICVLPPLLPNPW